MKERMQQASNSETARFHRRTVLKAFLLLAAEGHPKALASFLWAGQSHSLTEDGDGGVRFSFAGSPWCEARRVIQEGGMDAPRRLETDYSVAPHMDLTKGLFDALLPFVFVAGLPIPWRVSTAGGHGGAGRPSWCNTPLSTIEYAGGCSVILSPAFPGKPPQHPVIRGRHTGMEILEHGIRFFSEADGSRIIIVDPRRDMGLETCLESVERRVQATVAMILEARARGRAVYHDGGPAACNMVVFPRV